MERSKGEALSHSRMVSSFDALDVRMMLDRELLILYEICIVLALATLM